MTIKRTQKYVAAVRTALSIDKSTKTHKTADELYQVLEKTHHWDSKQKMWIENPTLDPKHEISKTLIRVRVTAHLQTLEKYSDEIMQAIEKAGLTVSDISTVYPNHRKPDGGGRVYITLLKQ